MDVGRKCYFPETFSTGGYLLLNCGFGSCILHCIFKRSHQSKQQQSKQKAAVQKRPLKHRFPLWCAGSPGDVLYSQPPPSVPTLGSACPLRWAGDSQRDTEGGRVPGITQFASENNPLPSWKAITAKHHLCREGLSSLVGGSPAGAHPWRSSLRWHAEKPHHQMKGEKSQTVTANFTS